MTTDFMICNRKKLRWSMVQFENACIALDVGTTCLRFTVLDASGDGISFFVPTDAPEIRESSSVNAAVRVGEAEIQGVIYVVHLTPSDEGVVCGGTFQPASELDDKNWQRLIADLAAADQSGRLLGEPIVEADNVTPAEAASVETDSAEATGQPDR